jgi:glycosyltransferase involved in cell wall biosynthesis
MKTPPMMLKVLERQLRAAREALTAEREEVARLKDEVKAREAIIDDFRGSTSWKLTAPVRGLRRLVRGDDPTRLEGEPKAKAAAPAPTRFRDGYATATTAAPSALFGAKVLIVAELGLAQCAKYRVWQKQRAFALLGIDCDVVPWSEHEAVRSALQTCSIAIFYRTPGFPKVLEAIAEAKRLRVPTLWEVDDLIFDEAAYLANRNLETLEPGLRQSVLDGVPLYRAALLACDYGLASTETLAEAMRTAGVAETFVVENGLDEETLGLAAEIVARRQPRPDGRVTVIYGSGSKAHDADFEQAAEGLRRAMAANPALHLRIVGTLTLSEAFAPFADRIDRIPPVDYGSYLRLLGQADISLAPLEATVFNDAKSNIKFLEAAVLELPSVCSPRAAFAGAITSGVDGFLAETADEWAGALGRLAADVSLRRQVGTAAADTAHRLYDPQALAQAQVAPIADRLAPIQPRDKLRVLAVNVHFAPESFGGATIVAEALAERLNRRDDMEAVVFTIWPEGLAPGFALARWEAKGTPVIGVRQPDSPTKEQTHNNPRMGEVFAGLLASLRPDVVHLHSIQGLSASLAEACREAGVPYVVTLHDSWWLCERQFMVRKDGAYCFQEKIDWSVCATCVKDVGFSIRRYERLTDILRGAALLLTPSAFHRALHVANGIDPALIEVNKNGVAPAAGTRTRPLDPQRVRFGFVGGIGPIKGLELIRRAFEHLPQSNYELILVDNTQNIGMSQMDVEHWKVRGQVTVVPAYTAATMEDFFAGLDVLLFPSQWKESFGLTVREASLRDVWVIATDGGGAAEDIVPGENGTIIPIGADETPLRDAIAAILDHPERLAGWHNPYKDRIRTFDGQAEELAAMLQRAAGRPARPARSARTRSSTLSQSPSPG